MTKKDINKMDTDELIMHPLSGGDESGIVFIGGERLFRAVTFQAEREVRNLFESGIVSELIEKKFIPLTWISDIRIEGFPLIIEQQIIKCQTYFYEWTFTMLFKAGELILNLRQFLNNYGYDIKDAHTDNIIFNGVDPLWVDIGSIIKNNYPQKWVAERRFKQSIIYPLQIWSKYGEKLGGAY